MFTVTALNLRFRRCCLEMMAWSLTNDDRAQVLFLLGIGWPKSEFVPKYQELKVLFWRWKLLFMGICWKIVCVGYVGLSILAVRMAQVRKHFIALDRSQLGTLPKKRWNFVDLTISYYILLYDVVLYYVYCHTWQCTESLVLFAHLGREEIPACPGCQWCSFSEQWFFL